MSRIFVQTLDYRNKKCHIMDDYFKKNPKKNKLMLYVYIVRENTLSEILGELPYVIINFLTRTYMVLIFKK